MADKNEVSELDSSEIQNSEILDDETTSIDNNLIIEEEIKKPLTKNEQARELMKSSAGLISEVDSDVQTTKNTVSEHVNSFEEAKSQLLNTSFTQSQILLEKASFVYSTSEAEEPFEISLGTEDETVRVNNINSGGFSGFILALLAALAVAGAWIYVASTKVGVALSPAIIENEAEQTSIFKWIGGITGSEVDPMFGMGIVGISALLVGWIVYKLRVSTKENKNFRVAHETYEKSTIYVENQKEAKTEMERIDEHIQEITPIIENYQVLLNEQNGKLQRILHVEGTHEENSEYHSSSIESMKQSENLMTKIEELVTTPITKEGKLNDASSSALAEAKSIYDYYISKIYA
jgi:hypothetical protein